MANIANFTSTEPQKSPDYPTRISLVGTGVSLNWNNIIYSAIIRLHVR
jgi:hypothetical protein